MKDFFRGWRRKAGCVTLVMACVFMAGWIRTLTTYEELSFRVSANLELLIESGVGVFYFGRVIEKDAHHFAVLEYCRLPYWLLVTILTFLSAYLLLGKPRPAKNVGATQTVRQYDE